LTAATLHRFFSFVFARFFVVSLFFLTGPAPAALSDRPREDFWTTDGPVRAIAETNGTIYIGGQFEYISPTFETGHAFDRFSGTEMAAFPKFAGAIKAILNDGEGGWFVGGQFTAVGGHAISNLAHVNADMTLDTNWAPQPNGSVLAIAREDSRLFIGGTFDEIGGETRLLLAALDVGSGLPLAWRADCTTPIAAPAVSALVATNGLLYVGGFFSQINGMDRAHIGAVESATGNVTDFAPNDENGAQIGSRIDAMAMSGNLLYVGGSFRSMGGNSGPSRLFLAALDTTRPTDNVTAWNPGASAPVTAIAIQCDTVYIAGKFTNVAGQTRHHLAAVAVETGELQAWNPNANGDVLTIVPAGNTIYAGGKFTQVGGQPRDFIAALEAETGDATFWNPRSDFGVANIAVAGGAVVSGGSLGPGGKLRKNVAAFDARTGKPTEWAPEVAGGTGLNATLADGVNALAVSSKAVYLGGPFTIVNGETRNRIASVDFEGALLPWNPDINGIVYALSVHPTVVYAGGTFDSAGGISRTNLVALNTRSGRPTRWNPAPDDKVSALSRRGGSVYAVGSFTTIGRSPRRHVAALNAITGRATSWKPEPNDVVSAMALTHSKAYVGGNFSGLGDQDRSYLAGVDRGRGAATCWMPDVRFNPGGEEKRPAINSLLVLDGVLHVGGTFSTIAGQTRHGLAALQTDCAATATDWNPHADDSVTTLAAVRGSVVAGGIFRSIGGRYRPNFAVFPPAGSPTITQHPESTNSFPGESVSLQGAAVGQGSLTYQWQLNGVDIPGENGPTLVLDDLQPEDTGDYVLVVTNKLGLVNSQPATLDVIQPLEIVSAPSSQTFPAGETIVLSVEAAGHPAPIYQWRLNGVNIPGAVNATYVISNATPQHGGHYEVVVANGYGTALTDATVIVSSPALVFSDERSKAVPLPAPFGQGSGSNAVATAETNEFHAGKVGGSSVWVSWTAPENGVAIFSTRGSTFDTIIGVYTNGPFGEVTGDDDGAGFGTSQAIFSAVAGMSYLIAIDGLAGATGQITLTWTNEPVASEIVRFTTQPLDQSVVVGGSVIFATTNISASPVTYQWFKNCETIPGATNSSLTLNSVTFDDVANYRVIAVNDSGRATESATASLEIGPVTTAYSHDKLEDLLAVADVEDAEGFNSLRKSGGPTGFVPAVAGRVGSQRFSTTRARTQTHEPLICDVLGGASKWFGLRAKANGTLVIDTEGSNFDTLLAAYRRGPLSELTANYLDCNDNGAPDGLRSIISIQVTNRQDVLVTVDGVNGQRGKVVLKWNLMTNVGVTVKGALSSASPAPDGDAGQSIIDVVRSRSDAIPRSIAIESQAVTGTVRVIIAASDRRQVLESSTNLHHWMPIRTNAPQSAPAVMDLPLQGEAQRFFRVR
jgi:hypothetical protein